MPQSDRDFILINVTEEYVKREVLTAMKQLKMCICGKCYSDVCAIVLNQSKCKYVTSDTGALYAKISQISQDQKLNMTILIAQACKYVLENPKH